MEGRCYMSVCRITPACSQHTSIGAVGKLTLSMHKHTNAHTNVKRNAHISTPTLTWQRKSICADRSEAGEAASRRTSAPLVAAAVNTSRRAWKIRTLSILKEILVPEKLIQLFSSNTMHARGYEACTEAAPSVWACVSERVFAYMFVCFLECVGVCVCVWARERWRKSATEHGDKITR